MSSVLSDIVTATGGRLGWEPHCDCMLLVADWAGSPTVTAAGGRLGWEPHCDCMLLVADWAGSPTGSPKRRKAETFTVGFHTSLTLSPSTLISQTSALNSEKQNARQAS